MANINLATKYEPKLDERFSMSSITDKWTSNQYTFDGVNAIKIWSLGQADIHDYNLNPSSGVSRFGAIREVDDEINTYQLTKKKSFNESFDETNVQDQMFVKKANAYLKQVWDEQMVPMVDEDRLTAWANGAGLGKVDSTALTKSTLIKAMLTANAALNNKRVPRQNRVFFVTESLAVEFRLADELAHNEAFTTKAIINGQIGTLSDVPVVSAPDDLMPSGVEFILKYKGASIDPFKMKMMRVITDSENVAGSLMQGLFRFDSFVLANKANGIYVYAKEGVTPAPTITFSSNTVTIAAGTGVSNTTIKYTTDGSNPKTSSTASTYSSTISITADTKIRAYQYKTGEVNSAIAEYDAVYSA